MKKVLCYDEVKGSGKDRGYETTEGLLKEKRNRIIPSITEIERLGHHERILTRG